LNIALNEIGPVGASAIAQALPSTRIRTLNISKNYLGDEAVIVFAGILAGDEGPCKLQKLHMASCRIGDKGVEQFFTSITENKYLSCVNFSDNFISEQLEPLLLECLDNNY